MPYDRGNRYSPGLGPTRSLRLARGSHGNWWARCWQEYPGSLPLSTKYSFGPDSSLSGWRSRPKYARSAHNLDSGQRRAGLGEFPTPGAALAELCRLNFSPRAYALYGGRGTTAGTGGPLHRGGDDYP